MERKVIQQNKTTLVVSLPKKWVEKYKIKKGDRLEVKNEGKSIIFLLKKDGPEKIVIDLGDLKENRKRTIKIVINELYRKGFEEILVKGSEETILELVEFLYEKPYLGLEVFSESETQVLLINLVSEMEVFNFDSLLSKITIMVYQSLGQLSEKNHKLEKQLDQIEKYCNLARKNRYLEGLSVRHDNIIRSLSFIVHAMMKINKYDFYPKEEEMLQIQEFFLLCEKLYYKKTSFEKVQSKYLNLEKNYAQIKIKSYHIFLWDIIRNISTTSSQISHIQTSEKLLNRALI